MSILGISCTALCSWESILLTSVPTLLIDGAAGVVWGLVVNWIGVLSVYVALAELASMAPTAGGQCKENPDSTYRSILTKPDLRGHWVAMLAPTSVATFLTYMTAWLTAIAWQAIAASVGYLIATLLQGIVVLAHPNYEPQAWQTVLLMWATSLLCVLMNSISGRVLSKFEGLILVLHLVGFFGVLIPLVYLAPHNSASDVFTTFRNNGNWPSQGLAFLGQAHSSERIVQSTCQRKSSQRLLSYQGRWFTTILVNGTLAFAIIVALLFCATDLEAAVAAADTLFYPSLQIFQSALNSTVGAVVLGSVILVLSIAASVGIYASASRMIWSFSRDRGLPFHQFMVKVSQHANKKPLGTTDSVLNVGIALKGFSSGQRHICYLCDNNIAVSHCTRIRGSIAGTALSRQRGTVHLLYSSMWSFTLAPLHRGDSATHFYCRPWNHRRKYIDMGPLETSWAIRNRK